MHSYIPIFASMKSTHKTPLSGPKIFAPFLSLWLTSTSMESVATKSAAKNIKEGDKYLWFAFHPYLCTFISNFISGYSVTVMADGHHSSNPVNSSSTVFYSIILSSYYSSMTFLMKFNLLSTNFQMTLLCIFQCHLWDNPLRWNKMNHKYQEQIW